MSKVNKNRKKAKVNTAILKDNEISNSYERSLNKYLEKICIQDIDTDWEAIKDAIKMTANQSVGLLKKTKNSWYNENCRSAIENIKKLEV